MGHWPIGNYMNNLKPITLRKVKSQASYLLKELKNNSTNSIAAANRFLQIPPFSNKISSWIIDHADSVQLKHAYHVIAVETGFTAWTALKHAIIENDCLYKSTCVGFVHAWFSDYAKAEIYFNRHGGYLICFWKDFVVCGKEYICGIGLSQYEEQWKSIGYNWVRPGDSKAFHFLKEAAAKNYLAQQ